MFPPANASICDVTIITERFTKLLTSLVLWAQDLHIISKYWQQYSITQVREVRRIMSTWAQPDRQWSVQEDKEALAKVEQNPVPCLTGLIHPLVTTKLPILSARNFSSVVCQYPQPEECLKHRVLKSAATAYFISVKTNFSKKIILYFVLYMERFLWERAFLDPQEVKASLRWTVAVEAFDLWNEFAG